MEETLQSTDDIIREAIVDIEPTVGDDAIDAFISILHFFNEH